ncbi:uncharacterized protein isoform X2 [Rhodnius prolixus]|uniref:uncharacterized protein isoform X2 n=1 Tax=Rhodnius prolixus TaxID=13249 RepID=UPI003D18D0DE
MPQHPFVWVLLWCSVAESLYKNVLNGDCPALNGEISKNACLAETCTSDLDCGTKAMCCSNGCVLTCIEVDPPKAFDWTEERAELRTAGIYEAWSIQTETFGGCHMTSEQFDRIKNLVETDHLKNCFCRIGGFYCHVPQR